VANHQIKTDPFAKLALIVGLALIALTVFILLNSLNNTIEKNTVKGEIDTSAIADNKALLTAVNIKPIGEVSLSDGSGAAPSATRSGEEVYNAVCAACHNSGAANAPKLDDKAAWEPRIANGFDALLNTAINGKGAMPARGGQNVPDDELTAAIIYMTKKAGFSLDAPKAEAPAATEKKAADTTTETEEAPAVTEEKSADTATEIKTEEAPAVTEEKVADTVTTTKTEEAPAAETETVATASNIDGKALYKTICFACHDTGAANAPKLTDKALWKPRIALGKEALYNTAINGKGTMPPKGGNMALSDDEVKAIVDYMVSVVQ
jgi:cytochrome c5